MTPGERTLKSGYTAALQGRQQVEICPQVSGIITDIRIAFGLLHPAFNLLFVQLVPAGRRGAATSTYLTSWDTGIGTGIFAGAAIAGRWGGFSCAKQNRST